MKSFRHRLKDKGLWDRDHVDALLNFLALSASDLVVPSAVMRRVADAADDEAAKEVLAERLWQLHPLVCKAVLDCCSERPHVRDELFKYIDGPGFRGARPTRPAVIAWLYLAQGLALVKMVGIAFVLDERGQALAQKAAALDIDDFLDEDQPEERQPLRLEEPTDTPVAAAPAPSAPSAQLSCPRGRERPVAVGRFAGCDAFSAEVLAETTARLQGWWAEQREPVAGPVLGDFGIDREQWMEQAEETLYRVAVAAALAFRLGQDRQRASAAFAALQEAGILTDLYYGTAPETLPERVDAQALMLASLVARRCAEAPQLAATLERQSSADAAFDVLDGALGRGLFKIELFWILGALASLGAVRFDNLGDFIALPDRTVRDTLFRLGYLTTPYAHDARALLPAAAAARRAAGAASPPHDVLVGFALAAGCSYDCAHKKHCEYACRERAE